jgi:hypothetical protein
MAIQDVGAVLPIFLLIFFTLYKQMEVHLYIPLAED